MQQKLYKRSLLNWGFFLETYLIFDFSILMVILISAIFAFMRGFSQEILSLFSWIVAISGSYFFANNFVNLINKFTENIVFSRILSYVIVFLVLIFFLSFLAKIFSNTIKKINPLFYLQQIKIFFTKNL